MLVGRYLDYMTKNIGGQLTDTSVSTKYLVNCIKKIEYQSNFINTTLVRYRLNCKKRERLQKTREGEAATELGVILKV